MCQTEDVIYLEKGIRGPLAFPLCLLCLSLVLRTDFRGLQLTRRSVWEVEVQDFPVGQTTVRIEDKDGKYFFFLPSENPMQKILPVWRCHGACLGSRPCHEQKRTCTSATRRLGEGVMREARARETRLGNEVIPRGGRRASGRIQGLVAVDVGIVWGGTCGGS